MNSVRYICGTCGTHFDIPVTYVNRKVRCKCGFVDKAIPTEVPTAPPPSAYQPPYRGGDADAYYPSKRKASSRKKQDYSYGERPKFVTAICVLGSLAFIRGCFSLLQSFILFNKNIQMIPDGEKGKLILIMVLALVQLLASGVAYLLLWGNSKAGVILLTIVQLAGLGMAVFWKEYSSQDMIQTSLIGIAIFVVPLWFVYHRMD